MVSKKPKNKIKHKKKRGKINEKKIKVSKNFAPARRFNTNHSSGSRKKTKKESIVSGAHKTKIRIIGIGGGGCSIVSEIIPRIKKADFVVANTDAIALKSVKKAKKFQFGKNLTHGLGTGMNVEIGESAALHEKEKIKKLFEGQDICVIISCLGGGTGCGATPVFAKISKSLNCLTYGIFTFPFEFEGEKKMEIAKEALLKIKPYLNIYSIIPNEKIFKIIDKNTPLRSALSAINEQIAENLEGLIEMIYFSGLINIDFADLKTILDGRGRLAYLKTIKAIKPEKEEITEKLISDTLYPYTIKGARGVLYNIAGGKDLQLSNVSRISKIISASLNKNAKVIFGINQSKKAESGITLTILASGCNIKNNILKPAARILQYAGRVAGRPVHPVSSGTSFLKKEKILKEQLHFKKEKKSINRQKKIERGKKRKWPGREKSAGYSKKKEIFKKIEEPQKGSKERNQKSISNSEKIKKEELSKRISKPELEIIGEKIPENEKLLREKKGGSKGTSVHEKEKERPKKSPKKLKIELKKPARINKREIEKKSHKLVGKNPLSPRKPNSSNNLYADVNNKIRRNALEVKKAAEEEERELIEKERIWETPAIFRKKK